MSDLQVGKYPSWYKLWEEIAKTTKKICIRNSQKNNSTKRVTAIAKYYAKQNVIWKKENEELTNLDVDYDTENQKIQRLLL